MQTTRLIINPTLGTIDRDMRNGTIRFNVGSPHGTGYLHLKVNGTLKKAHRVIWEYANGPIPEGYEIDHVNGVRNDNRIVNLRLVTRTQNTENKHHARSDNLAGVKGVQWKQRDKKYQAVIGHDLQRISLGYYDTVEAAQEAYANAAALLHTHNPHAAS